MKKQAGFLILFFIITSVMLPVFASGQDNFKKINTYIAGQFDDVKSSDWFSDNVANAYELGLMIGTGDTVFNSYGSVTIAEAVTMAARIHMIYTAGSENFEQADPWYRPYADYAVGNRIISRDYPDYNKTATRAEFAAILAGALPGDALAAINTVDDGSIPDVDINSDYSLKVYTLYRAGILAGNDAYGTFAPGSNIARAAAAAIVTRMADSSLRIKIKLEEAVLILYAADGRTRNTLKSEVEAYLKAGWYKEPVIILYAPDGRTRITLKSEIEAYLKVGWFREPQKIVSKVKKLEFRWPFYPKTWTYTMEIPEQAVDAYQSVSRDDRDDYFGIFRNDTADDKWMDDISETFLSIKSKNGYSDYEMIEFVISFVHSMDFSPSIGLGFDEYPKFPLESLYDQSGDSEDSSILTAALLRELSYGVVIVMFDDHVGVGVLSEPEMKGIYYEYKGSKYYYAETTQFGWQIGDLPAELAGRTPVIIPT